MKKVRENVSIFLLGGGTYYLMEVLYKGFSHGVWHSHWTMFLLGGLMTLIIGLLNNTIFDYDSSIILQSIIGGSVITLGELIVGTIANSNYTIWDYRDLPFNYKGQICLEFSIIWCLLSIVCILFDDWFRYTFFDEEKPHYKI